AQGAAVLEEASMRGLAGSRRTEGVVAKTEPRSRRRAAGALQLALLVLAAGCSDPQSDRKAAVESVRHWNQVAIDTSGIDHTPVAASETRSFGEQLGPGRASRAMAIVHVAVFEAVNAIAAAYPSRVGLPRANVSTSYRA